jgi:hypothetical protein
MKRGKEETTEALLEGADSDTAEYQTQHPPRHLLCYHCLPDLGQSASNNMATTDQHGSVEISGVMVRSMETRHSSHPPRPLYAYYVPQ